MIKEERQSDRKEKKEESDKERWKERNDKKVEITSKIFSD